MKAVFDTNIHFFYQPMFIISLYDCLILSAQDLSERSYCLFNEVLRLCLT